MYDALKVFSSSLRDFSSNDDISVEELDCSSPSKWSQGEAILKILDEVISTISSMMKIALKRKLQHKRVSSLRCRNPVWASQIKSNSTKFMKEATS